MGEVYRARDTRLGRDVAIKVLPDDVASRVDTETPTESATQPGTALGTVAYMSPEQIRSQLLDARSDLFSLGVVLYEMLSGKRPFQRDTAADTMSAILREEPPALTGAGQSIPSVLDKIVHHCLEKDVSLRTQSAREVIFALETLSTLSGEAPVQTGSPVQTDAWLRRHRPALGGTALLTAARRYHSAPNTWEEKSRAIQSGMPVGRSSPSPFLRSQGPAPVRRPLRLPRLRGPSRSLRT